MPFAAIAHHRAAQAASGLTLRGFVVSFDNAYKPVRQLAHAMSHPLRLEFARLLLNSHALLLGEPLADPALSLPDATRWLYEDAPFCLLAHNAELDPRFIYANHAAQRCFGYDWPTFFGMPSRLSARPRSSQNASPCWLKLRAMALSPTTAVYASTPMASASGLKTAGCGICWTMRVRWSDKPWPSATGKP